MTIDHFISSPVMHILEIDGTY